MIYEITSSLFINILVLLFVNTAVWGEEDSWGPYSCTHMESTSGNDHVVLCEIWPGLFHKVAITVYGLVTPRVKITERYNCADERRIALRAHQIAYERLSSAKAIRIYVMGFDARGRTLASVYVDSEPLRNYLIDEGVGRWKLPTMPRLSWCNAENP